MYRLYFGQFIVVGVNGTKWEEKEDTFDFR